MTMKKLLCIALALVMMLTVLPSCASGGTDTQAAQSEPAQPAPQSETEEPAPEEPEEEEEPEVPVDEYVSEGHDTAIEITGFAEVPEGLRDYFLSPGDRIAVITPSAMCSEEQTAATVEGLRSWGFEPVLGKYVDPPVRTLAECIEDLEWALNNPEIQAIFCVRGGYGSTEVLDTIPAELIANAKKPIIGYSDITAYHAAWTTAGLPSVAACMSGTFTGLPEECAEAEKQMMTGNIPSYRCESNTYCREGSAEGILIGGNLSTVAATLNAAYDATKTGQPYILFIEEVGESIQTIHRYLTILKHAGVLENAQGIVFGEFVSYKLVGASNFGDERGGAFSSVADMIDRLLLGGLDAPVAFGFPHGHEDISYPLLMGVKAKLDVAQDSFTLSWEP